MMTEIEVYYGYKIVDENNVVNDFIVGGTYNGHCYKDYEAFNKGEGVCYISEYEYEDMREQISSLCLDYDNDRITEEEYNEERQHILTNVGWTKRDLLELVGFDNAYDEQMQLGLVKLASIIFDGVDWQSPETYFNEFEITDDILSYCGLTEKQIFFYIIIPQTISIFLCKKISLIYFPFLPSSATWEPSAWDFPL